MFSISKQFFHQDFRSHHSMPAAGLLPSPLGFKFRDADEIHLNNSAMEVKQLLLMERRKRRSKKIKHCIQNHGRKPSTLPESVQRRQQQKTYKPAQLEFIYLHTII